MSVFPDRYLNSVLSYWEPSASPSLTGFKTYAAPVTMRGRQEDKNTVFIDGSGREQVAQSVYWTEIDVKLEGYLCLGSSTEADPTTVAGAKEIRAFQKIPSLAATVQLRKAFV